MLEGSIAFTLSGATNSKFKALFSIWLPDYMFCTGNIWTSSFMGLTKDFYGIVIHLCLYSSSYMY